MIGASSPTGCANQISPTRRSPKSPKSRGMSTRPHGLSTMIVSRRVNMAAPCWAGRRASRAIDQADRKSVVEGKSVSVRVDLGGRRIIKKKLKIIVHIRVYTENNLQHRPKIKKCEILSI